MGKLFIKIILILFIPSIVSAKGFIVDLASSSPQMQKQFTTFELKFDFSTDTLYQTIKLKKQRFIHEYSNLKRKWNIKSVNDEKIVFDQSYKDYLEYMHNSLLNDDFLVGSKFYKKNYKKRVDESGGLDAPAIRVEFDLENLRYTETFNPLSKKPKIYRQSFKDETNKIINKDNATKVVKAAIFIAAVYLIINNLDEINDIRQQSVKKNQTKNLNKPNFVDNSKWQTSINPYSGNPIVFTKYAPKWSKPGYNYHYGGSTLMNMLKYSKF